jgi:hypothetical protein
MGHADGGFPCGWIVSNTNADANRNSDSDSYPGRDQFCAG